MKPSLLIAGALSASIYFQYGCTGGGGTPTWYQDLDGDGYGNPQVQLSQDTAPDGYVSQSNDCNDDNADINPGAAEIADELDNNCNGEVDEGFTAQDWFRDADNDGFGDANDSQSAIVAPAGYIADSADCDDSDAAINPDADEVFDSKDNDCDGLVDEGFVVTTWYFDGDSDNYGDANTSTEAIDAPAGYIGDNSDCDDSNANINPGASEEFDGVDNNCNGEVDEGFNPVTWYFDGDADGYGDANSTLLDITQPAGYTDNGNDCDDNNAAINPGATEEYDSIDNNCNGEIDEGFFATTWYRDADSDGYGNADITTSAVLQPAGYVATDGDCDDAAAAVNPGATEVFDGIDNNCDGQVDEGFSTFYRDSDNDGYGDSNDSQTALTQPAGYAALAGDCDDSNADVNPGAAEIADGLDNDCDGDVDEGYATYYQDSDGDGFGNSANSVVELSQPSGYVLDATDCDDTRGDTYPGAPELFDNVDNDCDGSVDEGYATYYQDSDGDGYGNAANSVVELSQPSGYVTNSDDCNDNNSAIRPGASEANDDLDNNCNGVIDEGLTPRPPTGLTKTDSGCCHTYGNFSWNPVPNVQAYEIHMDAYFGGGCLIDASAVIENNSGSGQVKAGSLCLGTNYNVKIRSRRDGVWGPWTSTIRIRL